MTLATGTQPLCFVDHATHEMRIGYYNDTYVRTPVRVAAPDAGDDVHPAQRGARLRAAARLSETG